MSHNWIVTTAQSGAQDAESTAQNFQQRMWRVANSPKEKDFDHEN